METQEESTQKRKAANDAEDAKDPIKRVVMALEMELVQAWEKAIKDLDAAGVPGSYIPGDKVLEWRGDENHAVEMTIRNDMCHQVRSPPVVYTLTVKREKKIAARLSYDDWDQFVRVLKGRLQQMNQDTLRAQVVEALEDEIKSWKDFLARPCPPISGCMFAEGRMNLEWYNKNGDRTVRVYRDCSGPGMTFAVKQKPRNPDEWSRAWFFSDPAEAIKKLEELLTA